jgi:cysteine desulfurase
MPRTAYLDWNASAPMRAEAAAAMAEVLARCGNPSSVHRFGRAARQALEVARAHVAALIGAAPSEVVFTSGGTEANHLALRGIAGRRVMVSALEHDSVRQAAAGAAVIPATPAGIVDLAALERMLAAEPRPVIVSLMLANNETGALQPVAEAARLVHARGGLLHCDAVQAAGKVPVEMRALDADLLSLSAHKLGGPQGVGALAVTSDAPLAALQTGGGQERGRRAGTENLPGIVGFGVACRIAAERLGDCAGVASLRDVAERRLTALAPEAPIYAAGVARLPNTLAIGMPGVAASTQVMALDLAGVMVSAGAACSSGKVRRSAVLEAMGVEPEAAESAIRVSLGWNTVAADIDQLVDAWGALYARRQASAA